MGIISTLLLIIFVFFHWKKNADLFPNLYIPALLLKLTLGCFVGIVYTNFYNGGDTFVLFNDATILADIGRNNFLSYFNFILSKPYHYPTEIISKLAQSNTSTTNFSIIISFLCLLTNDNYWISCLYISFFCFCSIWYLTKKIKIIFPLTTYSFLFANFCIPSIAFWMSGILKEAIAIPCLYFCLGIGIEIIKSKQVKFKQVVMLICCSFVIFRIKFYYFTSGILFFSSIFYFLYLFLAQKKIKPPYLISISFIFIMSLIGLSLFEYHLNINQFPKSIFTNYQKLSLNNSDPYAIQLVNLNATWKGIFLSLPEAFIMSLYKPNYSTMRHFFDFLISSENVLFLLLIINTALFIIKRKPSFPQPLYYSILLLLLYSIVTISFLAIASPNLGSLSRYKIGASVFLYYLVFIPLEINLRKKWIK